MKTPILKKAPLYLVLAVVAGVMLLGINAAFGVVGDPFGIGVAPTFSGLTVLGEGNFNSELTVDGAISTQKTVSAVAIDSTDPAAMDTNNSAVYGYGGDGENMMGTGVFGRAIKGVGVQGVSDENIGGYFYSESSPYALYADNDNDTQYGWGIEGTSYNGIKGLASGATGKGVYGQGLAYGVYGASSGSGSAVYGTNTSVSGYAGRFNGRVSVENSVDANPVTGVAPLKVGAGGVFLSIDGNEVLSTGDNLYLNQDSGNDVVIGSSGTSADLIGYGNANFDNHLGVGTSSTTYPLQVYSTSDNIVKIQGNDHSIVNIDGTDGSEKSVNFSEDGVLQWKVGMDNDNLTDDDKDSGPGNLDLFVIKHVNNRTPEFSMDADGNVEIAGNLNINGNLTLGGLGGEVRMEDSPTTSVASLSTAIASVSCYGNDIMINCGFSSNSLMYPYAIRQDVYAGNPRCLVSMKNTATGTKTFLARATCLALN